MARAAWYQDGQRFRDGLLFVGFAMAAVVLAAMLAAMVLAREPGTYWWLAVWLPLAPLWFLYLWRMDVTVDRDLVQVRVWPSGGAAVPVQVIDSVQTASPLPSMDRRRHRVGDRWFSLYTSGGVTLFLRDGRRIHVAVRYPELLQRAVQAALAARVPAAATGEEE